MAESQLPNTESNDVINKAIAFEITMRAVSRHSSDAADAEEYAKEIANIYSQVLETVAKRPTANVKAGKFT